MTQEQLDNARKLKTKEDVLKFIADTDNLTLANAIYFICDGDKWCEVTRSKWLKSNKLKFRTEEYDEDIYDILKKYPTITFDNLEEIMCIVVENKALA